jgi:hypothetical protein
MYEDRKMKSHEMRICLKCNKEFTVYKKSKHTTCSAECSLSYEENNKRRSDGRFLAIQNKFNVNNIMELPEYIQKISDTKLTRYGNSKYNNIEKGKQYLQEKYGVSNAYLLSRSNGTRITKGQQKYSRDSQIHQAKPQLNYLKNISLFDNRIILDSFLDTLLYSNYYNFYKELKKLEHNIFNYGDPMISKLFSIKKFNCSFTKNTSLSFDDNKIDLNIPTIIFTNNYYFNNKDNEYLLFITDNKDEMNILNNNMDKKRFIGNFYYVEHRSKVIPSIFFDRNYLNVIKNILKHVNIINCNTYLLLILSIMLYFPNNHYFSYKEVIEQFGLNIEEKKLVLFLHKKNKLRLIS